jgi:hypothetical protein
LTARFADASKNQRLEKISITWDELFAAIGPTMFGYIVKRGRDRNFDTEEHYPFEVNIRELLRTKIFELVGQRNMYLFPHEIDRCLIQFKQLGYIVMNEKKEENGIFRGFTLTELGEHKLTALSASSNQ